MRPKNLSSILVGIIFTIILSVSTSIASDVSSSTAIDPKILEGRWEGNIRGLDSNWSSYYALEIFHVDIEKKRVMLRRICTDCRASGMQYWSTKLKDDKDKIAFETTGRDPIEFVLKGNYLSGFQSTTGSDMAAYRYDFTLKRVPAVKKIFDPKELIGQWVWASGSSWRELIIEEVDGQNGTFKGRYKIDTGKEYPLTETKIIILENELKIDFWTTNKTSHYQLKIFPNFNEYPQVLWGKLERLTGEISYKMFRKKEKQD